MSNNDRADNNKPKKNWVRCNEQIRIPQICVIQEGKNLGTMNTRDALNLARSLGLDLVEVAPDVRPPVCRIMDYGKFMFDKSKKEKHQGSGQKEKEICFRYVTDQNDLMTKSNQAKKFIEKGFKVKLVVKFKQREKAHKDLGFEVLNKVIDMLKETCSVDAEPKFEGGNVVAKLDIKKVPKKEPKKDTLENDSKGN